MQEAKSNTAANMTENVSIESVQNMAAGVGTEQMVYSRYSRHLKQTIQN